MTTVLVGVAGAAGAVARYWIGLAVGVRGFPWATLAINVSGSFLLALLLAGPAATRWSPAATTAVAVGLLGAYTTFSTFGYETWTLLRTDRVSIAVVYVAAGTGAVRTRRQPRSGRGAGSGTSQRPRPEAQER